MFVPNNRTWVESSSSKKSADQEGGREKPNDWLGPQNGSGDPFPSAEIDSKKDQFLSRVRSGRTNHSHFTQGGRQRELLRHEGPQALQASVKNRTKSISPWKKKRFSSGTPSKKYKISNFGAIFLYTQISFTTLSHIICFDTLKGVYNCSKGIHVFYVTMWSILLFHASFQLLFTLCYLA